MKPFDSQSIPNILIIVLFLVVITFLLWSPQLQIEDAPKTENQRRRLVSKPEIAWNRLILSLPDKYSQFISDQFPVRNHMIRLSHWVRLYVFQEKFISTVIIGKDGWLHFNSPRYKDICQNAINWGNHTLNIDKIRKTNEFLANNGVTYAIMIIPEKCQIYPEGIQHLLPDLAGQNSTIPLMENLSKKSDVITINLFGTLSSEKDNELVYFKTDTHWSTIGAYLSYQEIIKSLLPDVSTQEIIAMDYDEDLTLFERKGDLGKMFGLPEFLPETTYQPDICLSLAEKTLDSGENIFENPEAENDLTLIVFHDSFFRIAPIKEFLASHFHRTVYMSLHDGFLWSNEPEEIKDMIDKWDPDFILIAPVERNLELFILN